MSAKISLNIGDSLDELQAVRAAVEELAETESWSSEWTFQVNLALEELAVNVMSYAYDDENSREIEITLSSDADTLTIEITDNGRPFDPLHDAPAPDLEAALDERTVGGLGLHLVRTLMDEVEYRREQDRNHLTLVKRKRS